MAMPAIGNPPHELAEILTVLCWDQGTVPVVWERELDKILTRVVGSVNPDLMDQVVAWLGRERFIALVDQYAETMPVLGLTLAVYRYGMDRAICGRGLPLEDAWMMPVDDEHDGLRLLQAKAVG